MNCSLKTITGLLVLASACSSPSSSLRTCPPPDLLLADDIRAAVNQLSCVESISVDPSGMPTLIVGEFGVAIASDDVTAVAVSLAPTLGAITAVFRLQPDELVAQTTRTDSLGMTHVRYQQRKNDIDVLGGTLEIHMDARGVITGASGAARGGFDLTATADVPAADAVTTVTGSTPGPDITVGVPRLVYVISSVDDAIYLAWEVPVAGIDLNDEAIDALVYIDASTGREVDRHSNVMPAKSRRIHDAMNARRFSALPGNLIFSEGDAPVADAYVMKTYENLGKTYDCYSTLFARESYDGDDPLSDTGSPMVASLHFRTNLNNAYWRSNKNQMALGDGDGVRFGPFGNALDLVAHEFTHGVIRHTADLIYRNEPGAINEGWADIMGAACEANDDGAVSADTWKFMEDIYTPGTPGDARRYMDDPAIMNSTDYYPNYRYATTAERAAKKTDFGHVHTNSGIANLAFKLLVTGGKHPRGRTNIEVPALGMEKARLIFYRALTTFMHSRTRFLGARKATESAAKELYDQAAVDAVGKAWDAVGVTTSPAPTTLTGKALDYASTPSRHVVVTVELADFSAYRRSVRTQPDGTYTITGIPSKHGEITVTVACASEIGTSNLQTVTPVPGGKITLNLDAPTACGCGDQGPGWVACPISKQCAAISWFCDGTPDCPDGEDEVNDQNGNACP